MYENMVYLLKNKEAMDVNLIILQEEKKKKSKLIIGLKYQLKEKLKALKEKNQNLLDLQWKVNEQEKKIFDLHTIIEKNKELEPKLEEAEKTNEAHEKAIEALKWQIKKEHDKAAKVVELCKAFEKFKDEASKSSEDAYDYAFSQYQNLIKKLYLEMDIFKVTPKVAIKMGVKGDLESPPKAAEKPTK